MRKYYKCEGKKHCISPCYIQSEKKPTPNKCWYDESVIISEITKEEFSKEIEK